MRAILDKQTLPTEAHVMIGRQPIYNDKMGVYGYELLFRAAEKNVRQMNAEQATAQVLAGIINNFGLNNLVGQSKAAINVTESLLPGIAELPLTYERIILDLPDALQVSPDLLTQLKHLATLGFTLSVNGLMDLASLARLLPCVHIVRVDVHQAAQAVVDKLLKAASRHANLALLALKVESLDAYSEYRDQGFKYCQGYFLSKPKVYFSKDLPANRLSVLNLLATVNDPQSDTKVIETIVSHDVALSYKLLKLINSPAFGLRQQIESISQALVLLGRNELRSWVSLLALSSMDARPLAMIELALLRAKMCELLAHSAGLKADSYFTVGMFSALDILMERPLPALLNNLPLSDAVKDAILNCNGEMGRALRCALAYENAEWDQVRYEGLSYDQLLDVYMQALRWTENLLAQL